MRDTTPVPWIAEKAIKISAMQLSLQVLPLREWPTAISTRKPAPLQSVSPQPRAIRAFTDDLISRAIYNALITVAEVNG
jgi:hypothetical protein